MDMSGEYEIAASRETVWAALNDPDVLRACIPGCEELDQQSETEMTATVVQRIGPVKAKFKGRVELQNLDTPNGYDIVGEGQGGVAGFAKGGARVDLEDTANGGTLLKYNAQAQIGGKLAQIGSRLVASTAKKVADKFFSNFADHLSKG